MTKITVCSCEDADCDHILATAFEFLGAMQYRGMCEKQMYAVALAMNTIADDTIDAMVDGFARVDTFGGDTKPSLGTMLQKFLESKDFAEKTKAEVVDTMNNYVDGSKEAQARVEEFIGSCTETIPGFSELLSQRTKEPKTEKATDTEGKAEPSPDTLIDAIKRLFPGAQVTSIDISRFGSKGN